MKATVEHSVHTNNAFNEQRLLHALLGYPLIVAARRGGLCLNKSCALFVDSSIRTRETFYDHQFVSTTLSLNSCE
jgi:hypothetical protein